MEGVAVVGVVSEVWVDTAPPQPIPEKSKRRENAVAAVAVSGRESLVKAGRKETQMRSVQSMASRAKASGGASGREEEDGKRK